MADLSTNSGFVSANPLESYEVSISSSDAPLKTGTSRTNSNGLGQLIDAPHVLRVGDVITVALPGRTLSMRVPAFNATVSDDGRMVNGTVAANSRVHVFAPVATGFPPVPFSHETRSDASGRFSLELARQVQAGAPLFVTSPDGAGNYVRFSTSRRGTGLVIGSSCIDRVNTPFTSAGATLRVIGQGGAVKVTMRLDVPTTGPVCLNVPITSGDRIEITGAGGQSYVGPVPPVSVAYNGATGVISGSTEPNRAFKVYMQCKNNRSSERFGTMDASGAFTLDISDVRFMATQPLLLEFSDANGNTFTRILLITPYSLRLPIAALSNRTLVLNSRHAKSRRAQTQNPVCVQPLRRNIGQVGR